MNSNNLTENRFPRMAWDLDWNLLRTFMVIVERESITDAAQFLNLKQPSVSNALKRLETTLDCRLIERRPRTFSLTPQGEALYKESLDIFGSIDRIPNVLVDKNDEVEDHVNITMACQIIKNTTLENRPY